MRDTHDFEDAPVDPTPCYATAEEIALAERLRRRIEERYLREDERHGATRPDLPLAA